MPDYNDILKRHSDSNYNKELNGDAPDEVTSDVTTGGNENSSDKDTLTDILSAHSENKSSLLQGFQSDKNIDEIEPYIPGFSAATGDEELHSARADNQSNWEKTYNMGKQMLGEVVGGAISGVGSIFELPDAITDQLSGESADFNNFMIEWGEGIKEYAKESGQIYRSNPNQAFDFGDFGWWAENGVSLASTVGLMIPAAGAVRGVSLISDILKITDKVGDSMKYWSKLTGSAAVMRNAENMTESLSVSNKSRQHSLKIFEDEAKFEAIASGELGDELRANGKVASKENLADLIGAKAGWRSYKVNSANIVFDMVQMAPLFKGFKAGTRTNKAVSSKVDDAIKGHGFDSFGKVTRVRKVKRFFNPVISPIARQSTEGIEEGINFIGGAEGEYYGKTLAGGKETNLKDRLGEYLTDGHFYESAMWGIAGGVAFDGATGLLKRTQGYKDNTDTNKITEIEQRKQTIDSYKNAHASIINDEDLTPNQKSEHIEQLQDEMAIDLAMRASAVGNVDILLEQIEHPQFKQQLIESELADAGDVDFRVEKLKNTVLDTEKSYNEYYNKFFVGSEAQQVKNHLISESIKTEGAIRRLSSQNVVMKGLVSNKKAKDVVYQNNLENGINEAVEIVALEETIKLFKGSELDNRVGNLEKKLKDTQKKYKDTIKFNPSNKEFLKGVNPEILENLIEQTALEEGLVTQSERLIELGSKKYKAKLNKEYNEQVAKETADAKAEDKKVKRAKKNKAIKKIAKNAKDKIVNTITKKKDDTPNSDNTEDTIPDNTDDATSTPEKEVEYPNDIAEYNEDKYKDDEEFQKAISEPDSIDTWLEIYGPNSPLVAKRDDHRYKTLQNRKAEIEANTTNSIFGLNEADTQTAIDVYSENDDNIYTDDTNDNVDNEHDTIDGDLSTNVDTSEYDEENQRIAREEGDTRVVNGTNILAYLSRGYENVIKIANDGTQTLTKEDTDNALNKDLLDKNILNPNEYQIGDKLTIGVDKDYNVKHPDGNVETYNSLKANEEVENSLIPIAIYKNGKKVAYLHDLNWINSDNVAGDVESQKTQLQAIRSAIAKQSKLTTITITNRNHGKLARTRKNRQIDAITAFPDTKLQFGIGKNGKLYKNREDTASEVILNSKFGEGAVYAIAPVSKDNHIGIPLRRMKVAPHIASSIVKSVKIYLKNDESSKEAKDILENYDYNILTAKGLKDYINNFINVFELEGSIGLEEKLISLTSDINLFTVTTNSIDFGTGRGIQFNSLSRETPANMQEDLLQDLQKHLAKIYMDFDMDMLNSGEFKVPLLTENENIAELSYNNYNDFIKSFTTTNLLSFNLGNGNFGYTIQPVIETSVGSVFDVSTQDTTTSDTIDTTTTENTTTDIDEDDMLGGEFSPAVEGDKVNYQNIIKEIEESVLMRGFTANQQDIITSAIAYDINDQVISNGKLKQSEVFNNWLSYFKSVRNTFNKSGKTRVVAEFDKIINNFDSVKLFTLKKVGKINGINIKEDTTVDGLQDLETHLEKTNYNDEATLQLDNKDTISVKLKRFFSGIYKLKEDGNIARPYMGLKSYVPFDVLYNEVSAILANSPADYNDMIKILEKYVEAKPYLRSLISKLQNADQQTKNQFVVAMSKHKVNMVYLLWTKNRKTGAYNMTTKASNQNDLGSTIVNSWSEGLKATDMVSTGNENNLVLNDNINVALNKLEDFEETTPTIEELGDFLESIGIDMSPKALKDLKENGLRNKGKVIEYDFLFSTSGGVFKILKRNLKHALDSNLADNNPFKDTSMKSLALLEAQYNTKEFSNSFRNGEGKSIYSFSNNKYFIDRVRELKTNKKLQAELKELSYNGGSTWLTQLMADGDNLFKREFNYFYLDSLVEAGSGKRGKKLSSMSEAEQEITKLGLFWNRGVKIKEKGVEKRVVKMFYPTMSDKTTMVGFTTVAENIKLKLNGDVSNQTIELLYKSLVEPELKRAVKASGKTGVKGYDKGSNIIFSIPQVNNVEGLYEDNGDININALADPDIIQDIKNTISKHLDTLVKEKLNYWKEIGITNKAFVDADYKNHAIANSSVNNMLKYSAVDYIVNTLVTNQNAFQLLIGDPALFYKSKKVNKVKQVEDTFENISKRLASQIAPGMDLADSENDTYKQGFIKDYISSSKYLDAYSEYLSEADLEFYKEIEGTDAQEYTTVAEHLYVMQKLGKLTDKEAKSIEKKALDGTLNESEIGKIFQPMKPVYVGQVMDKANDMQRMIYIKSSSFPLVPQLTKGLELDKLRKAMEHPTKGADRVSFSTANKVGDFTNPTEVFDDNGDIHNDIDLSSTTLKLNRNGFRIQQEVPYKASKAEINDGSQQRKLLFVNILGIKGMQDLKDRYDTIYHELYKNDYEALIDELDIKPSGSFDRVKLHKILVEEAESRNYSINDIQSLKIDKNGRFVYPLAFNNSASKFEALLTSIVDNRVRKKKFRGNSFVLGSEEGFKVANNIKEGKVAESSIVFTDNWSGELKPQRVEDGVIKPAQILIPFKFRDNNGKLLVAKDYVDAKGRLDMSRFDKDILESFGFRIPTQGPNSMAYMEVVGFLPASAGDLLIAPREFTIQMGSDFDVDKLYSNMYNTVQYAGVVRVINDNLIKEILRDFDVKSLEDLRDEFNEPELRDLIKEYNTTINEIKDDITENKELERVHNLRLSETRDLFNNLKVQNELKSTVYADMDTLKMVSDVINPKHMLQNELLAIHFDVLSNPSKEIQAQILEPLGFGTLETDAKNIEEAYGKASNVFSPLSDSHQKQKYINGTTGKAGVGVFSSDSVFNALLQNKEIDILDGEGKPLKVVFGEHISNPLSDTDVVRVDKDEPRKYKSQTIVAFQSAAVDNANENIIGKMNVNTHTFSAIALLNQMGFNESITTAFINQPIIRDYVKAVDRARDITSDVSSNVDEHVYLSLQAKYKSNNYKYDLHKSLADKSVKGMLDNIRNYENTISKNNIQLAVLDKFLSLKDNGDRMKEIQGAINSDSSGIDTSLIASASTQTEIGKLFDSKTFLNAGRLIGEATKDEVEGSVPFGGMFVKPTTINGFVAVYGVRLNNLLWSNEFHYHKMKVKRVFNTILKLTGKSDASVSQKISSKKEIWNNMKSYTFTSPKTNLYDKEVKQLREELLFDTDTNKSLATIIQGLSGHAIGINNAFINKLTTDIQKGQKPSLVTYNSNASENFDESNTYAAFVELLTNNRKVNDTTTREIAEKLIQYQFLTGGLQQSKEFVKYIPVAYLNELGFSDYLHGAINDLEVNFIRQFIQNNAGKVPRVTKEQLNENKEALIESFSYGSLAGDTRYMDNKGEALPFISIYNKVAESGYDLYELDEQGEYHKISTLGSKSFKEYDQTAPYLNSTVDSNLGVKILNTPTFSKVEDRFFEMNDTVEAKPLLKKTTIGKYGVGASIDPKQRTLNFLNNVVKKSKNKLYVATAKKMLNNLSKINTPILIDKNLNARGKHVNGIVSINPDNIKSNDELEQVIMHELIHAFTKEGLKRRTKSSLRLKGLFKEFRDKELSPGDLKIVKEKLKAIRGGKAVGLNKKETNLTYAGVNVDEFVALVIESKEVQDILAKTDYVKDKSFLAELIDRIVALLEDLGFKGKSDLTFAVQDIFNLIETVKERDSSVDYMPNQASTFDLQFKLGITDMYGKSRSYNSNDTTYITKLKSEYNSKLPVGFTIEETTKDGKTTLFVQPVMNDYSPYGDMEEDPHKGRYGKFGKLIKETDKRIGTIKANLARATNEKDYKKVIALEARLNEVEGDLEALLDSTKLEDIQYYAEKDLNRVADILNNDDLGYFELEEAQRLVHIWQKGIDLFFTSAEKTSDSLVEEFSMYQIKANRLNDKLVIKQKNLTTKLVARLTGEELTVEQMFNKFKDVNSIKSKVLDISHVDNLLLQAVWKGVKLANNDARLETNVIAKTVDDLIDKASPYLGKGSKKYDKFKQLTVGGAWTGDLVHRFNKDYLDTRTTKFNKASRLNTKVAWEAYYKWKRDNELIFDVRKILPDPSLHSKTFTKEGVDKHIAELKAQLGEKGYKKFYNELVKKVEKYKGLKEVQEGIIALKDITDKQKSNQLTEWEVTNSPYYASQVFGTGKSLRINGKFINPKGFTHTTVIPKGDKWYDNNFKDIEANEDLSNLYDYLIDTLGTMATIVPDHQKKGLRENTLPEIKKSIINMFSEEGIKGGVSTWYNKLMEDLTVNELSDTTYTEIDPLTDAETKKLKVGHLVDNSTKFVELMKRARIEFQIDNGRTPTVEEASEIRDEVNNALLKEKSFDLGVVLKAYSASVLAYKHKALVEPQLKLANSILNNVEEVKFNAQGVMLKTPDSKLAFKSKGESFTETKKMYQFYFDSFYGSAKKLEGVQSKKVYTPKERVEKKKLEGILAKLENDTTAEDYTTNKNEITEQLDALGSNRAVSKVGDKVLQFVQLKGMSYNVLSGFANMMFGLVDNITTGSDGRMYNNKEYFKGLGMVLKSTTVRGTDEAKKISNLMQHLDVLKDASDELFESSAKSGLHKRMKFLAPYEVQKRTEYVNQAPIMIAMLNSEKVEGSEMTLWEAMNGDGTFKEGSGLTKEQMDNFKVKLDQVIKMNHGNYDTDSAIMGKQTLTGRALMQFRTWMFEATNKRFGDEMFDSNLGITRKGRYRTLIDERSTIWGNKVFLLKMLARKLSVGKAFNSLKFEDRFNEVDAANMRTNFTELVLYTGLMGVMLMLKNMGEDDEKKSFMNNLMINQMLRLQTDMEFYINPSAFETLTKNSVPAMSLITDVSQWLGSATKLVMGDDEITSGVNSGDSRFLRESSQMLPLGTQVYRVYNSGRQLFDK